MKKKTIYFLMFDKCIVHGGFFDNFEYYYLIKKMLPEYNVKWRCITSHPREDVIAFLQDKYDGIDLEYWKDIEVIPHVYKKFYKDPLMMDMIFCATNSAIYWFVQNGSFQAARSYIGLADWRDVHPKHNTIYKKSLSMCDERIFDYEGKTPWRPYRKKILFDKYRKKDFGAKYDFMLNLSLEQRRFPQHYLMDLFDKYDGTFACYTGHKNEEYYSWMKKVPKVNLIVPPVKDFMGLFKTFLYLPYRDGWDATPRLFPECIFYGKEIELGDDFGAIKAGGYYRYHDTVKDYDGLWLREDDEIIDVVREYLQ